MKNDKPIGIFDSGLGGLTVLNELIKILPQENYIYVGDLINSPYGEKTPDQLENIARNVISYLVSRDCKMVIVACNTASTVVMEKLRDEFETPILTVVEAAVNGINQAYDKVLLAATPATVGFGTYKLLFNEKFPDTMFFQQACRKVVPLIETGSQDDTINQDIVNSYMSKYELDGINLVILGCTHYPIWRKYFENALPEAIVFDPAEELAREAYSFLETNNLLVDHNTRNIELIVTKHLQKFLDNSKNIVKNYEFNQVFEGEI